MRKWFVMVFFCLCREKERGRRSSAKECDRECEKRRGGRAERREGREERAITLSLATRGGNANTCL